MICNKCKSNIPNDSEFCQYCGTAVEKENGNDTPIVDVLNYTRVKKNAGFSAYDTKKKSKKKTIIIAIAAIFAAALIGIIAAFFTIEYLGYRSSETQIMEAKYQYAIKNKNNSDKITYTYLKELRKQDYKDSAEIYEDLYEWRVTVIAVNSSEDDKITNKASISGCSPIYFHIKLTGGEPNGSVLITTTYRYPNGDIGEYTFDNKWADGETGWYGWDDGLYKYPGYGATGTLQCKFYDEDGNFIGGGSVRISE